MANPVKIGSGSAEKCETKIRNRRQDACREFGECVRRSSGTAFVAREIAAMAGASVEEKERILSRREERERKGRERKGAW
jgi:hypothetical protein